MPWTAEPSVPDAVLGGNFTWLLNFGYEPPSHVEPDTAGAGNLTYDEGGLNIATDGNGDRAELRHVRFNNSMPNGLFYWQLDTHGTAVDEDGLAILGGRGAEYGRERAVGVDLIEDRVFVSGQTKAIPHGIAGDASIFAFVDQTGSETVKFFICDRNTRQVVTVDRTPGSDTQRVIGTCADGDHRVVISFFGWTPLWDVPL